MRIGLVYATRQHWHKFQWVDSAFRGAGHDVTRIRSAADLKVVDRDVDLVLFEQRGGGVEQNDLIDIARTRSATWCEWVFDLIAVDSMKSLGEQNWMASGEKDRRRPTVWRRELCAMDIAFIKERECIDEYQRLGINAVWLDQGCPIGMAACEPVTPEWDVMIVGSAGRSWRQRRDDVKALIAAGLSVAWAGHATGSGPFPGCVPLGFCPPLDLPGLASRAAVTLGVDMRHDIDGYWSDRLWLACGMGSCHLRRLSPGLPIGPYPTYRTTQELVEQARFYLEHPDDRHDVGRRSREWVMAEHTYGNRIQTLLAEVKRCKQANAEPARAMAPSP